MQSGPKGSNLVQAEHMISSSVTIARPAMSESAIAIREPLSVVSSSNSRSSLRKRRDDGGGGGGNGGPPGGGNGGGRGGGGGDGRGDGSPDREDLGKYASQDKYLMVNELIYTSLLKVLHIDDINSMVKNPATKFTFF